MSVVQPTFFPDYLIEDVSTPDLRAYVIALKLEYRKKAEERNKKLKEERKANPDKKPKPDYPTEIAATSINKQLATVSGMLKRIPEIFKDYADYRPPKFPWEKVSLRRRQRPLTEEEDTIMLAALRGPRRQGERALAYQARLEVADLFEVNLNTGMRGGETVQLTWPQIDFVGGEIYLGQTKNGDDRFVPMNSRVHEILSRRYQSRTSKYVFPNWEGTQPRLNYAKTFRLAAERAGLPYGRRAINGFTMHSTRHTATTRMLRKGSDVRTVQEIVGHSDMTMTLVYSHATSESRKRAVESLVSGEGTQKSQGGSKVKR